MAFVAVDKDGTEVRIVKAYRRGAQFWYGEMEEPIKMPKGSIKKLFIDTKHEGRELTWDDEPVELEWE